MRFWPGILVCLLAGCVSQPTSSTPSGHPAAAQIAAAALPELTSQHVLRIGLEFLPPDERFPELEPVRVEARRDATPAAELRERVTRAVTPRNEEPSRTPRLAQIDFESIDDPIARETMHFCSDLIAADRQRVRREVGIPFFDFRYDDYTIEPLLTSERRLREDHEQWSQQHGTRLLKQPLRQLAKRLPIAREFELAIQDFRSDHVPLTEPYRKSHGDRRELGRMSVRLHIRDLDDPMEVVYIHPSGVRVGTSRLRGKMSLDFPLGETLHLSFRARTDYETGESGLRTDLIYRPSANVSVHLAAGDNMDFLSTSSLYSLFESPMDGSPGVLLYAVHTF